MESKPAQFEGNAGKEKKKKRKKNSIEKEETDGDKEPVDMQPFVVSPSS